MRKRLIYPALVTAIFALVGVVSAADNDDDDSGRRTRLRVVLEGFQENPSISTTGVGRLDLRINNVTQTIEYELSYRNLEGVLVVDGVVIAAHIHLGARHTNGGVVAFLCGGGGKPACPNPEGTVAGTIVPTDITGPMAQGINAGEATAWQEFIRAIRAGYTYANVHTTRWPGGEIRGQIPGRDSDRD